jgi:transposase
MPKAYSLDLRQKIVDAYDRGNISQRRIAQQFGVANSFVEKLLKQRRETDSIVPKVRVLQTPPKLNETHRAILAELVEATNDATLAELRDQLHERTDVRVGITTMHNTLKRMGITVKKNVSSRPQGN